MDPVVILLDSSKLSLTTSLWAAYFKSFVKNPSAGDPGLAFNPLHSCLPSLLSLGTISVHSLSAFLAPPSPPSSLSGFPPPCPLQSLATIARGQEGRKGGGAPSGISLHPSLTPTNASLHLAPLLSFPQAPETPSAPPCPSSEGCPPPPPGMQLAGLLTRLAGAGWGGELRGQESGFSGNEIAPRNNERATFLTFCVSVHSIAHIVLAPGGNLTSEKAAMKWVWVEILRYFHRAQRVQ